MYPLGQKYVLLQSTPCNYNETNVFDIYKLSRSSQSDRNEKLFTFLVRLFPCTACQRTHTVLGM